MRLEADTCLPSKAYVALVPVLYLGVSMHTESMPMQGAQKSSGRLVGGTCVKSSGTRTGTSGLGVFLWVLCTILFTVSIGAALLWLQQAGLLSWDYIRSRFRRSGNALDESLYHELSMDTGF